MKMSSDESDSENLESDDEDEKQTEESKKPSTLPTPNLNDRNQKQTTLERTLPRVNCEERIIFVVDLCKEEESTAFHLSDGSSYSSLQLIKKVLNLFLHNKKAIDSRHKYALIVLHESPHWLVDFTLNPRDILNEIETSKESSSPSNCDLSQVFDLIKSRVPLPGTDVDSYSVSPPPYVVRTILLYGRSICLPQFLNGKESFTFLNKNPHFFLDVLYMHEVPTDDNKCEGIFDLLCDLDQTGWSYIFEVGRNATKFHNLFSKLLAHPLQRPAQKDTHYALLVKD